VALISALNIYPVKSCRGIALQSALVTATGLEFDREWMLMEAGGEFVTQRQRPRLALIETSITSDALQLRAPGMTPLSVALSPAAGRARRQVKVWRDTVDAYDEGEEAVAWFARYLGAPLRLLRFAADCKRPSNPLFTREYEGFSKFADGYALLVVGTASLADLNRRLVKNGGEALPMNRFRPNLVIEGDDLGPYDEDRLLWMRGNGIALKPVKGCVRCTITTTDQATAQVAAEPLLTLATYRVDDTLGGPVFGQNAIVVDGIGRTLRVGDALDIEWNF
jgi:uncharacterized protein